MKKYKQKKYRQKMLAIIMILALAALALTGCGQEAGSGGNSAGGGSSEGSGSGEIGGSGGENRQSIRAGMEVPEELTDVNRQIGDTSFEIFRQAAAGPAGSGKSAMISPMSLLVCLSMAQAGAEGNTKAEMEQAFGWTSGEFASWLDCWYGSLTDEDETRMNVANSFWYRQGFRPENDYLKMLKDSFHGTARESAFDDGTVSDINRWCDENTYGMIPHFIDHLEPDQSALLLNAVVFEGKWLKAYDDAQVSEKENFVTENKKSGRRSCCILRKTGICQAAM